MTLRGSSATLWPTTPKLKDRQVGTILPQITLQEMMLAFKEVVIASEIVAIITFSASGCR